MANVSSSNGIGKQPKLRFPEFTTEWAPSQLGVIGEFYGGLSGKTKEDFGHGAEKYITYRNVFTNTFASPQLLESVEVKQNEKQNRVQKGDALFTQSSETFEEVGMSSVWLHNSAPFLNSFCMGWHPKTKKLDPVFMGYLLRTPTVRKQIVCQGQGISRINLAASRIANIDLYHPVLDEQVRVAAFLTLLDKRIECVSDILERLKKYKRGVSNKVFNEVHADKDSTIINFADAFVLLQNNTFSRDCLTIEKTEVLNIHYGDILVKYGAVVDPSVDAIPYIREGVDVSKYSSNSYLKNGDVVFADTAEDYAVGKVCEIFHTDGRKILSGLHTMPFRPTFTCAPMYLGYYLNSAAYRVQVLPMIQGAKVSSISKSEIRKTKLYIPSLARQQQIVKVLYALDQRIDHAERILEALKKVKTGLLQHLFV